MDIEDVWTRIGHTSALFGKNIISIGGYLLVENNGQPYPKFLGMSNLYYYNTERGTWSMKFTKTSGLKEVTGSTCAIIDTKLYMYGGHTNWPIKCLYALDLNKLKWNLCVPKGYAPNRCNKLVSWSYKNNFYIFGGYGPPPIHGYDVEFNFTRDSDNLDFCWIDQFCKYNVTSNEWTALKLKGSHPEPCAAHAAVAIDSKVYIFGGRTFRGRINNLYLIDLKRMHSTKIITSFGPCARSWHSFSAISESEIILYGGLSSNDIVLSDCWVFNTITNSWSEIDVPSNNPRVWHTSVKSIHDEIIIMGGSTRNVYGDMEVNDFATNIIKIRRQPPSLLRLCLEILKNVDQKWLNVLPTKLQELTLKYNEDNFINIP